MASKSPYRKNWNKSDDPLGEKSRMGKSVISPTPPPKVTPERKHTYNHDVTRITERKRVDGSVRA